MANFKYKKKIDEILNIILKRNIALEKYVIDKLILGKLPDELKSLDLILGCLGDELVERGLKTDSEPNEYGLKVEELINLVVIKKIQISDKEEIDK